MARNEDDFEDEDRPRKPRRRNDDDEVDERPRRPRSRRDDDDDEVDERPRRRARSRRDDDDDLPSKPKTKSKLPLILGIVAFILLLVCGGAISGVYYAYTKVDSAATRLVTANNLKQIGIGAHNFHSVHNGFPTNSFDANGKPLLSWRVHLLPYVEEAALYAQFHLNEPWDSQHNKTLLARMPMVYATANERKTRIVGGKTYYRGFSSPGGMLEPIKPLVPDIANKLDIPMPGLVVNYKGYKFMDITDGTSNTLFCVEAGESVDWTKPDDLNWAPGQPVPNFGGDRSDSDTFNALFCDGSVKPLKKKISPEQLKALITRNGKEPVVLD